MFTSQFEASIADSIILNRKYSTAGRTGDKCVFTGLSPITRTGVPRSEWNGSHEYALRIH